MYGKISDTVEKREDIFFQCGKLIFFIVFYFIYFSTVTLQMLEDYETTI